MKKTISAAKLAICIYITFCLITGFAQIGEQIKDALKMWAGVLLPSLFPYLVLSQYVSASGLLNILKPVQKFISKLFNISDCSAGVYMCSLVSGYPSGAICSAELYKKEMINKKEAERLVCLTNNAGPLFLISAVGGYMLGCTQDGIAMYVIQNISAALTAIVWGKKAEKVKNSGKTSVFAAKSLTACCTDAVTAILAIGGYLTVAATLGAIVTMSIKKIPCFDIENESLIKAGVYFVLEISSAMRSIASLEAFSMQFPLMCAAASWGGVSVIMQIKGVLPEDFSSAKIICARAVQGALSFCLGWCYRYMPHKCSTIRSEMLTMSVGASVIIFVIYVLTKKKAILSD